MVKYAVVDLETSGPSIDRGDKIIQIGIVVCQDGEITDRYNQLVNPHLSLSRTISRLTGIYDHMLVSQPSFDQVAGQVYQMLEGAVFVAHNINFDYKFLSTSLKKAGYPPLKNPGIDTVQLARVLYPQAQSYKLADISETIGYQLDQAHSAYEDALATAHLLLAMQTKVAHWPASLMTHIRPFLPFLIRETGAYLSSWWADNHDQLASQKYQTVKGLCLSQQLFTGEIVPDTSRARPVLRPGQQHMLTDMVDFINQDQGADIAFVNAPSGLGKSLAYLLACDQAVVGRKLISTATIMLQEQLVNQSLPALVNYQGLPVRITVLKAAHHYIDLNHFLGYHQELMANTKRINKKQALTHLAVLVWLSETTTGDLSELNRGLIYDDYWQTMRQLDCQPASITDWGPYAFYDQAWQLAKNADYVITNHAFCLNHQADLQALDLAITVFDESHNLPDMFFQANSYRQSLADLIKSLDEIQAGLLSLADDLVSQSNTVKAFGLMRQASLLVDRIQVHLDQAELDLKGNFQAKHYYMNQPESHFYLSSDQITTSNWWTDMQEAHRLLADLTELLTKLDQLIDESPIVNWLSWLTDLTKPVNLAEYFLILSCQQEDDQLDFCFNCYLKSSNQSLARFIQSFNHKKLLVSATNNILANDDYIETKFGLPHYQQLTYPAYFNYQKQVSAFLLTDRPSIDKMSEGQAAAYIVDLLTQVWQPPILKIQVFFQSYSLLDRVYHGLDERLAASDMADVFAQHPRSSKQKLRRQYDEASRAILLSSSSFSQGVHLASGQDLMIITRLPFRSPNDVFELAKADLAKQQQQNYFNDYALPEMLVRLRQLLGRALTSLDDHTYMISLDHRIIDSSYHKQVQASLPENMTFVPITLESFLNQVYNL
ncbi:hypothetical protein AWM75_06850 [Aerococcus urinaehominis]|uniref:DNA polymerase III polC-type n=1 Tax=Aerococcus urinaehominis TaxID=128944 RepID=A0A0X8FLX3_9LACT|nr:exonuclease domain-containing protein [Aerococcus urinaehominis]AMB99719.1 hypothetical protein AWM75_06850 [Aerococcus urinaehominis]SDL91818.1 ATP-dependent DNA helicase DinG [Aerococcus urinaehominis]